MRCSPEFRDFHTILANSSPPDEAKYLAAHRFFEVKHEPFPVIPGRRKAVEPGIYTPGR